MNGGALRCFYLVNELAKQHEVYVLTIQPETDFEIQAKPLWPANVKLISIAGKPAYRSVLSFLPAKLADAVHSRMLRRNLRAPANSYFLKAYPALKRALRDIKPSLVILENLEAVGMFAHPIKKQFPSAKIIYDAHNVDSVLWRQLAAAQNDPLLISYAEASLHTERHLHKTVDAVFCCSEHDRLVLTALNAGKLNATLIPNGVDCSLKIADPNPMKFELAKILFCGSL